MNDRVRFSVFIATSLDGFIARPDGRIDWLTEANARVPEGEDCGYAAFMATVDGLVMGRATLEQVLSFPEWPYGTVPVFVLSDSLTQLPKHLPPSVRLMRGAPADVAAQLAALGHRHLYLDGGVTIQRFMAAGLVSALTITTIPVLLGSGRPLFGPIFGPLADSPAGGLGRSSLPAAPGSASTDVHWVHEGTRAFDFGFVQSRYRLIAPAQAGPAART